MNAINELRTIRTGKRMPIAAVVSRSRVSSSTIVLIEKHGYEPTQDTKQRLASALGVEVRAIWPTGNQSDPPTAA